MSQQERYFTVPLGILRSGQSALEVLEDCVSCGIVNAGTGYREVHGKASYDALLKEATDDAVQRGWAARPPKDINLCDSAGVPVAHWEVQDLWRSALAGAKILGIQGGYRLRDVEAWLKHCGRKEVFFRMKSEWLWAALYEARMEGGDGGDNSHRPLSWREFRVLAAILSAKVNAYGFTFCGWELIQARACGFHNKLPFKQGRSTLPAHCQPLSRQMIRDTTGKLEALGFFGRCRYSTGKAGGMMAYTFRHPNREDLVTAVKQWRDRNRSLKVKTASLRASDQQAFKAD